MLTDADRQQMGRDLMAVRDDNAVQITIRRAGVTLPPQTVRIARQGMMNRRLASSGLEQNEQRVVVVGDLSLDIQKDDRFNAADGSLYEVDAVRPNRTVATVAEARMVG